MKNSKLINILKALDPVETRQFYRYVRSPFFTKSEDALKLYKYIRKFYPDFDTPKLERERVYAKLFPNSKYNGPKLRNLILKLTKILEDYLIYVKCQQASFAKKKMLTQIYGERNMYGLFEKNTKDLLQELEEQPFRGADFFYDRYSLQRYFYFHPNTPKQGEVVNILKNSLRNLQEHYQIERLQIGLDLTNRERIYAEEHNFKLTDLKVPQSKTLLSQLLQELIILSERNPNSCSKAKEASFFQAKKLFIENIQQISSNNRLGILTALVNFAIWRTPMQSKYIKESYDLYRFGLRTKLLLVENEISNVFFLNICVLGSKLKDFDYVEDFILQYESFLNETTRSEIKALALSFLYYHKAKYAELIKILENFRFSNVLYKVNATSLLLRTYYQIYEQDPSYYKLVIAKCRTFRRFINNIDILNDAKKEPYLNFTSLLRKITQQKELVVSVGIKQRLLAKANNYDKLFAREWIEEKIKDL